MMKNMIIRLDDASEKMNIDNWLKMENLLDKYNIKPIVGIIPKNEDLDFINYEVNDRFCELVKNWENKGWHIAMHGYKHVFATSNGGLNPVNKKSEFAGLSLEEQSKKIKEGYKLLKNKNINPHIFFAPAHTFDLNTVESLRKETDIRIISDTIANDVYFKDGFYYIPQQCGKVRNLPFKTVTFCYHPNTMNLDDFNYLESFIKCNIEKFKDFSEDNLKKRKYSLFDKFLRFIYFKKRR